MFGIKIAIFAPKRQQFLISAANSDAKAASLGIFLSPHSLHWSGGFFCKKCPALLRGDINLMIALSYIFPFL